MASRESQGLQIALILFVMVTVVLAVATYTLFLEAEEKTAQAVAARAETEQFGNAAKQLDFENQLLKHVLGIAPKTRAELDGIQQWLGRNGNMESVLDRFQRDMDTYAVGLTGQNLNYVTLQTHLLEQANRRNSQLADSDADVKNLHAELDDIRQAEARRTAKFKAELIKLQHDYESEKQKLAVDRERLDNQLKKTANILPEKRDEIQKLDNDMRTAIEERESRLRHLRGLYQAVKAKYEATQVEKTPERPDGEIVYVNQRANLVWINLGSSDGLQRRMYFSVYEQSQIDAVDAKVKARIQVTAIKEPHLAEARLLTHELTDPVMKGDKIYSPVFRKGQKTRFALAGFLDVDGDGKSDQTKVKSIITTNGGVVDAELLADGSITGKVSIETRFLVKGEAPTDKTDERLINGWNTMQEEATRKGLETISLRESLDRMGYHDDTRVINLQSGGPGGTRATEQFRKRKPSGVF